MHTCALGMCSWTCVHMHTWMWPHMVSRPQGTCVYLTRVSLCPRPHVQGAEGLEVCADALERVNAIAHVFVHGSTDVHLCVHMSEVSCSREVRWSTHHVHACVCVCTCVAPGNSLGGRS